MTREDIEGVVQRRPSPPSGDEVAEHTGDQTDDDGGHRADVPRGRRDRDETAHRSDRQSDRGRLALTNPVGHHPAHARAGCGQVRHDERVDGHGIRRERAPCVESEPAEPQERRAEHDVGNVVRPDLRVWCDVLASSKHEGGR